jgi:hypothetical protein
MKRAMIVGALLALGLGGAALAADKPPVVVELFTSQGCSSCPPANANLIELSKRDDVLALSFAVTYWDRLGWKDIFGREDYTARQYAYEPGLGERGPFTPQMVINGRKSLVGNRLGEVEAGIVAASPLAGPPVRLAGGRLEIAAADASGPADIWLVRYDSNVVEVPIARGENTGRTLPHTHVVHDLRNLGQWDGKALSLKVPEVEAGLSTAVLVQLPNGGAILSAVTDESSAGLR